MLPLEFWARKKRGIEMVTKMEAYSNKLFKKMTTDTKKAITDSFKRGIKAGKLEYKLKLGKKILKTGKPIWVLPK
jgi:hypothetical protein